MQGCLLQSWLLVLLLITSDLDRLAMAGGRLATCALVATKAGEHAELKLTPFSRSQIGKDKFQVKYHLDTVRNADWSGLGRNGDAI